MYAWTTKRYEDGSGKNNFLSSEKWHWDKYSHPIKRVSRKLTRVEKSRAKIFCFSSLFAVAVAARWWWCQFSVLIFLIKAFINLDSAVINWINIINILHLSSFRNFQKSSRENDMSFSTVFSFGNEQIKISPWQILRIIY